MAKQNSFVKFEHDILPALRQSIGAAESTEDVKKFFVRAVQNFLQNVCGDELKVEYEDIALYPAGKPYYRLSERIRNSSTIEVLWKNSDADSILERFAEMAANRYKHLETHPEKTEAKMFRQHAPIR